MIAFSHIVIIVVILIGHEIPLEVTQEWNGVSMSCNLDVFLFVFYVAYIALKFLSLKNFLTLSVGVPVQVGYTDKLRVMGVWCMCYFITQVIGIASNR